MSDNHQTTTLILAGGKGRRLNGLDKGLVKLKGTCLIDYSRSVAAEDSKVIASVNRNVSAYTALGYECLSDQNSDYKGPMQAIWQAATHINTKYLLVLPCDTPMLPNNIAEQLLNPLKAGSLSASYASHNGRGHYCCMAAHTEAIRQITAAPRSMRELLAGLNAKAVECSGGEHSFLNINTEQDLVLAQQ